MRTYRIPADDVAREPTLPGGDCVCVALAESSPLADFGELSRPGEDGEGHRREALVHGRGKGVFMTMSL